MRACLVLLAILVSALPAAAQVTQPNGLVIPRDSANGETQLYTLFSSRGEAIDFVADGRPEPATFSPLCEFTATFVLNQAGSQFGLAWYDVDPARATPPEGADLHVIVPAGAPVGTRVTSADIRSDPAYSGGLIGFALVGGQTHYSETRWNPVCTSCAPPAPWIMAVIYRSTTTPDAFYLAFEDGTVGNTPVSFNNDGDYNDDVFFLEGLVCAGGGVDCDTGMPGLCGAGLTECNGGAIECRPTSAAGDEACNGVDDDCDGDVDDGDLCETDEVCDRGVCVGRCMGEFGCAAGLACSDEGLCVESACVDVECEAGEICRAGTCTGPCTGVTCPGDQLCRAGRCVDPCDGVTCDDGRVCDRGICRDRCDCEGCADGLACDTGTGTCETSACVGVDCTSMPGTVCRDGACVDACAGAVCPRGQICEAAACVADPDFGADAGVADRDAGVALDAGGTTDAGGMDGGGSGGTDGGGRGGPPSAGCGCRATSHDRGGAAWLAIVVGLVLAIRRRRR